MSGMTFRREASVIHDYILFVHNGQSNILEHRCKWHVITILGWAFSSSCTTVEWRETNTHTQIETLTYLWLLLIWNLIQNRRKIGRITISSWMLRCFNVIPDYFSHFFLTLALWNIIPIQSFLGRKKDLFITLLTLVTLNKGIKTIIRFVNKKWHHIEK